MIRPFTQVGLISRPVLGGEGFPSPYFNPRSLIRLRYSVFFTEREGTIIAPLGMARKNLPLRGNGYKRGNKNESGEHTQE
jgi:hypothetical protein